jgi:general stress protein 26
MSDDTKAFWDRMAGVNAGMLGVRDDTRLVPMSHYADPATKSLWFITAQGTDLVSDVEGGAKDAQYVIASGSDGIYALVNGQLSLSTDAAKLDEIWNAVASSWFEEGKRDPDIRLLQLSISDAEVWATSKSSIAFLYQIAKAKLTGEKPDMGEHFTLTF